jgi:tetratricopeptide (TPR) repeat protein
MARQGLVVKVPIRAFPIGTLVLSVCVVLLPLSGPRVAGAQDSNLEELFRQAQAASAAKDYAGAEALYRRILRADPTLLPARVNLGLACYWQHKNREAVTEFQKALRVSPKEFTALLFSGLAYLDLGEYDRAQVQLQTAARVQDMDALLFWALGSLAMIHGDANAAVPLLERSLALDANNVRAVWLLGQAYARLAYRRGEKPIVPADYASLTAQTLRWIEERQPDSALLHVFKGDVLVARKLTSEALEEYQKALEIDPHWPDIHLLMANLLGLRGRWDKALQHLKLQLQDFPDDTRALVEMGSVYCRAGNYQAALPILAQAVTRDRDNYEANFRLGQARVTLGMFELAVPPLERATRVNPERSDPFYLLYRAYRALKQPEKASWALAQFKARKAVGPPPEAEQ